MNEFMKGVICLGMAVVLFVFAVAMGYTVIYFKFIAYYFKFTVSVTI